MTRIATGGTVCGILTSMKGHAMRFAHRKFAAAFVAVAISALIGTLLVTYWYSKPTVLIHVGPLTAMIQAKEAAIYSDIGFAEHDTRSIQSPHLHPERRMLSPVNLQSSAERMAHLAARDAAKERAANEGAEEVLQSYGSILADSSMAYQNQGSTAEMRVETEGSGGNTPSLDALRKHDDVHLGLHERSYRKLPSTDMMQAVSESRKTLLEQSGIHSVKPQDSTQLPWFVKKANADLKMATYIRQRSPQRDAQEIPMRAFWRDMSKTPSAPKLDARTVVQNAVRQALAANTESTWGPRDVSIHEHRDYSQSSNSQVRRPSKMKAGSHESVSWLRYLRQEQDDRRTMMAPSHANLVHSTTINAPLIAKRVVPTHFTRSNADLSHYQKLAQSVDLQETEETERHLNQQIDNIFGPEHASSNKNLARERRFSVGEEDRRNKASRAEIQRTKEKLKIAKLKAAIRHLQEAKYLKRLQQEVTGLKEQRQHLMQLQAQVKSLKALQKQARMRAIRSSLEAIELNETQKQNTSQPVVRAESTAKANEAISPSQGNNTQHTDKATDMSDTPRKEERSVRICDGFGCYEEQLPPPAPSPKQLTPAEAVKEALNSNNDLISYLFNPWKQAWEPEVHLDENGTIRASHDDPYGKLQPHNSYQDEARYPDGYHRNPVQNGISNFVGSHMFDDAIVTANPGFNAGAGRHVRTQQESDWERNWCGEVGCDRIAPKPDEQEPESIVPPVDSSNSTQTAEVPRNATTSR